MQIVLQVLALWTPHYASWPCRSLCTFQPCILQKVHLSLWAVHEDQLWKVAPDWPPEVPDVISQTHEHAWLHTGGCRPKFFFEVPQSHFWSLWKVHPWQNIWWPTFSNRLPCALWVANVRILAWCPASGTRNYTIVIYVQVGYQCSESPG